MNHNVYAIRPDEHNSLDKHVEVCHERFLAVIERIDSVDHKMDRLEQLMIEMKSMLQGGHW